MDGSFTNSPEETLQCMLDIHLSDPELLEPGNEVLEHNPILSDLGEVIVTGEKAKYAADQFKPYKAPEGDGVHPILLQEGWETLEPVFLMICRASLKLGHIPKIWQKARGIFIPKPGKNSYNMAKSFRLITLTSFQLKVMERMIYWHLNSSLGVDKMISPHQHGFRTGKSTESALQYHDRLCIAMGTASFSLSRTLIMRLVFSLAVLIVYFTLNSMFCSFGIMPLAI